MSEKFLILRFFPDGTYEKIGVTTLIASAKSIAMEFIKKSDIRREIVQRVVVKDWNNCTVLEWDMEELF